MNSADKETLESSIYYEYRCNGQMIRTFFQMYDATAACIRELARHPDDVHQVVECTTKRKIVLTMHDEN